MNQDGPECVFSSQNFHEASLVREMLESSGVPAFLFDSNAVGSVAVFGPAISFRVMVAASNRDAALKIMKEREGK